MSKLKLMFYLVIVRAWTTFVRIFYIWRKGFQLQTRHKKKMMI